MVPRAALQPIHAPGPRPDPLTSGPFVYVAGKWADKASVRTVQSALVAAGMVVSHDWTASEEPGRPCEAATGDATAAATSHAVVAVYSDPEYAYRGTNFELGVALGAGVPVFVYHTPDFVRRSGPDSYVYSNVFAHLPFPVYTNLADLVAAMTD